MKPKATNIAWLGVYFGLAAIALWWNRDALKRLESIPLSVLFFLLAGQGLLILGSALFNYVLYRSGKIFLTLPKTCSLIVHGQSLDQIVPRGGLMFRLAALKLNYDLGVPTHLALLSLGALLILSSTLLIAVIATLALIKPEIDTASQLVPLITAALIAAVTFISIWPRLISFLSTRFSRLKGLAQLTAVPLSAIASLGAISLCNQLLYAFLLRITFGALGSDTPIHATMLFSTAATLATTFGFMPGSLGLLELSLVSVGTFYQLTLENALLAALLMRTSGMIAVLILLPAFAILVPWKKENTHERKS